MRFRSLGLLAVMTMVVASCGVAPQSSGPNEGIAVHGDWTIEVYNEDGTLDERVEFENALDPDGSSAISSLLAGTRSAGDFKIRYETSGEFGSTASFWEASAEVMNGTVVVTAEGPLNELADSFGAQSISRVSTEVLLCGGDIAPDNCTGFGSAFGVTEKVLDQPVDVATGQIVQVEVVISFTSG